MTLTLLINAPTTEGLYAFLGMNASTEGQQLTAENLYAQLDSLIEARRAALKDLPIFRDVEVSPGCCPKEGIRRALYHQPSYFARKLQRCAWKAKKREATEDSVRREYWTKMLRSVALTYKRMFHKGSLSPELYGTAPPPPIPASRALLLTAQQHRRGGVPHQPPPHPPWTPHPPPQ